MPTFDNWHDYIRLLAFVVSLYSLVMLVVRYRKNGGQDWNVKTKDYWFALVMWSSAGCVLSIQGIALNRPLTPGLVLMTAAILVTGKGVFKKGPWGSGRD